MSERDAQNVVISRQSILLVTAVGVGLLTLTYVLGVQVGKQSAALRAARSVGSGEDLRALPQPLSEQLKHFEAGDLGEARPEPSAPAQAEKGETTEAAKAEAGADQAGAPKDAKAERWTLQLLSTTDASEAARVAARAKAAGFPTETLKGPKGQLKLRLARSGPRADMDAAAARLKAKGLASFAVRAE